MGRLDMTAAAMLARADAAGVSVKAYGGRLRLEAQAPPPPALLHDLARVKADILDLLAERDAIGDEPKLPVPGSPEREILERRHLAMVNGLMAAADRRRWGMS